MKPIGIENTTEEEPDIQKSLIECQRRYPRAVRAVLLKQLTFDVNVPQEDQEYMRAGLDACIRHQMFRVEELLVDWYVGEKGVTGINHRPVLVLYELYGQSVSGLFKQIASWHNKRDPDPASEIGFFHDPYFDILFVEYDPTNKIIQNAWVYRDMVLQGMKSSITARRVVPNTLNQMRQPELLSVHFKKSDAVCISGQEAIEIAEASEELKKLNPDEFDIPW